MNVRNKRKRISEGGVEGAKKAAISLLDTDSIILIAVYPGHEEGRLEGEMLAEMLQNYDRRKICVSQFRLVNSPTSPFFFAIESK